MKIDKHYVSDIDKKLAEFDAAHPKSRAQQAEYDKYQKIYRMRDQAEKGGAHKCGSSRMSSN